MPMSNIICLCASVAWDEGGRGDNASGWEGRFSLKDISLEGQPSLPISVSFKSHVCLSGCHLFFLITSPSLILFTSSNICAFIFYAGLNPSNQSIMQTRASEVRDGGSKYETTGILTDRRNTYDTRLRHQSALPSALCFNRGNMSYRGEGNKSLVVAFKQVSGSSKMYLRNIAEFHLLLSRSGIRGPQDPEGWKIKG